MCLVGLQVVELCNIEQFVLESVAIMLQLIKWKEKIVEKLLQKRQIVQANTYGLKSVFKLMLLFWLY